MQARLIKHRNPVYVWKKLLPSWRIFNSLSGRASSSLKALVVAEDHDGLMDASEDSHGYNRKMEESLGKGFHQLLFSVVSLLEE